MGLVEDAGMSVGSICPTFAADRDLSHPDGEVRENAARYVRGSPISPAPRGRRR